MTPAKLIQRAEERSIQDTGGISYEHVTAYLANGWAMQGSFTSRGFVRAGESSSELDYDDAHPETLTKAEPM